MPRKLIRRLLDNHFGNAWDRMIDRARRRRLRRFLLLWNRGLGDIALGLCQVVDEIRDQVPDADITVITRSDLAEPFRLLAVDHVIVDAALRRDQPEPIKAVLQRLGIDRAGYDVVLSKIDPTRWFRDRPRARPELAWLPAFDALARRFDHHFVADVDSQAGAPTYVGIHVQCETASFYSYRKDWPLAAWNSLLDRLSTRPGLRFVLFGINADVTFDREGCIDLRGRTSFLEMMAVIKDRCAVLVAPDSGVLTMTYYLGDQFPIGVVSLWADPRQGILKQGAASPNRLLAHIPLSSVDEQVASIGVDAVVVAIDRVMLRTGHEEPLEMH